MSSQVVIIRALHSGGNGDLFIGQRSDTREYVVVKYLREWHLAHNFRVADHPEGGQTSQYKRVSQD